MKKPRYEKPVSRDLSSLQIVQGSCWSGTPEYTVGPPCTVGDYALSSCSTGGIVMPKVACDPLGNSAGGSCWNGHTAG